MKRSLILSLWFLWMGAAGARQAEPGPPLPGPGNLPATTGAPSPPVPAPDSPASPPAQPAPPPPVAGTPVVASPLVPSTYTVRPGDNPWAIARKHGITLEDLLKANEIKDPKKLKVGHVLQLPQGAISKPETTSPPATPTAVPAATVPANATNPPAVPAGAGWVLYTVQKGDNPWKIAKALKVEHRKIISLNEGVDFTRLKIGQAIKVPAKP